MSTRYWPFPSLCGTDLLRLAKTSCRKPSSAILSMHFWAVLSGTPDWTKAWVSLYAPDFLLSADISDANDEVWVNLQENLFYHKREFNSCLRAEQRNACFIAQLIWKQFKMMDFEASWAKKLWIFCSARNKVTSEWHKLRFIYYSVLGCCLLLLLIFTLRIIIVIITPWVFSYAFRLMFILSQNINHRWHA